MKVYAVHYPFNFNDQLNEKTWEYYPSLNKAKKEAADQFVAQEEYEDEDPVADHLCHLSAKVYEVEVQLKRSVIAAIMNGETPTPATTETLIHEFRYRRGKIVVTNAKAVTESENVG